MRFKVSKEENERIAEKIQMNKSRLIQNAISFYQKNFKGNDYFEDIKKRR